MPHRSPEARHATGLCAHGNPAASCPVCAETQAKQVPNALAAEELKELNSLDIKVETDLSPALEKVNAALGTSMLHRESGFHVTILGPTEAEKMKDLSPAQVAELQRINGDIAQGVGIELRGIGVIDGSTARVPEKDRERKAAFIAVDAPALNGFRKSLGLPEKDLHITLGFEGGDIHYELTGEKDEKGKPVKRPIEKRADPKYDQLFAGLPEIAFGGLGGEKKEKKKEKPVDPAAEEKKKRKQAIGDAGLGGKDLISLGFAPGPEMGKLAGAIEKAVITGEPLAIDADPSVIATLEERIRKARESLEA